MAGFRVYYDWFAGTASNLLAAGIMEAEDPGLTDNWAKDKEPKEEGMVKYAIVHSKHCITLAMFRYQVSSKRHLKVFNMLYSLRKVCH